MAAGRGTVFRQDSRSRSRGSAHPPAAIRSRVCLMTIR